VLARSAPYLSRELLRLAYVALVRSHLEYCSTLFASSSPTQLSKLDTIQRIAARIICGLPRDAHAAPLLQVLGLNSLEHRRNERITRLVESVLSGHCHPALNDFFTLLPDGRVRDDQKSRITIGRKRISVVAAQRYNAGLSSD
jgi:hypothetical protein